MARRIDLNNSKASIENLITNLQQQKMMQLKNHLIKLLNHLNKYLKN